MEYDNASGEAFYHYADSDHEEDEPGYISTGSLQVVQEKYEQPLSPRELTLTNEPEPPRRPSLYPSVPSYSTVKPKPPPIELIPSRRQRHYGAVGLIGLIGLVGLVKPPSSSPSTRASVSGGCLAGSVVYYAGSSVPSGYLLADGSTFDATTHPELQAGLGSTTLPNLIDRYARGSSTNVGTELDAEIDLSGVAVEITDQGHSHIDGAGYSVKRDGQYTLAHLYSFDTDGMNLRDSASIVRPATCGITANLVGGGTETRPASTNLLPLVCVG